jgi:hypothetical protein
MRKQMSSIDSDARSFWRRSKLPGNLLGKIAGFLVCLLPLSLLVDPRSTFFVDWFNHLWLIEYSGEYIKDHGSIPPTLLTTTLVGIPVLIFYAGKFYAVTGLISAFVGSAIAFRIVALLVLLLQFWHVERAVRSTTQIKALPLVVATIVTWGIYPLTNLYNRSALTEFVAVALLTASGACLFVLIFQLQNGVKSYYDVVAFGLFYVAAALTHPLTAMFGCIFLLPMGLVAFAVMRRPWLIAVGGFSAIMCALVLSPWCYAVRRFSHALLLTNPAYMKNTFRKAGFFPDSIDSLWSRLSPLPVDFRSILKGTDVSTPYLDAQIMFPVIVLLGGLAWVWCRRNRGSPVETRVLLILILCLSAVFCSLFLAVSVDPNLAEIFGGVFDVLQFPYRLTTYVNLELLICVLALAGLLRDSSENAKVDGRLNKAVLGTSVLISLCALESKLVHASAVRSVEPITKILWLSQALGPQWTNGPGGHWYPGMPNQESELIRLPVLFYGYSAYTVTEGFATKPASGASEELPIFFLPNDSTHFGRLDRIEVDLTKPTLVITNVQAFPWNRLIVDGVKQDLSRVATTPARAFSNGTQPVVETILLPAGKHVLEYRFSPDLAWRILDRISWIALVAWVSLWVAVGVMYCKRRNRLRDAGVQGFQDRKRISAP